MKFFVQQVDQEQIEIDIPKETSLEQLREHLVSQHSYPDQRMIFIFNGNILKDADSLSGLKENSLITVYVKNKTKKSHRKSRKQVNKSNSENPTKETADANQEEINQTDNANESKQNMLHELIDGPISKSSEDQIENEPEPHIEEPTKEISIENDQNSRVEETNQEISNENQPEPRVEEPNEDSLNENIEFESNNEDELPRNLNFGDFEDDDYDLLFNEEKILADMAECFKKIHLKQLYDSDLQFNCQLNETRRIGDLIQHNPALKIVVDQNITQNYSMATATQTIDIKSAEELAGFIPFRPIEFEDEAKILLWKLTLEDRDTVRQLMERFHQPVGVIIEKYLYSGRDLEITEALLQTMETDPS